MAMTSKFLFINKKYKSQMSGHISSQKIEPPYSESNFSLDSLEDDYKKKMTLKHSPLEHSEGLDTVLVPFYEKDVLVKIPKQQKITQNRQGRPKDRIKEPTSSSYLVNKDSRHSSYLEKFLKQLSPPQKVKLICTEHEIRSISPEVGDTDRESIEVDISDIPNTATEFYNTESYNEMYYEKLLSHDVENYLSSYEDGLNKVNFEPDNKFQQEMVLENLKSVSEISHVRRVRRTTLHTTKPNLPIMKLGGLGPDVEKIKPRLERARSLQRYSEKVRMENRLRIYKRAVQQENDKVERELSANHRKQRPESKTSTEGNASYLVNKSESQKSSNIMDRLCSSKSKSADPRVGRTGPEPIYAPTQKVKSAKNTAKKSEPPYTSKNQRKDVRNERAKSSTRNRGINTETKSVDIPPVHINFMVNMGGLSSSSALRTLEEKHRMYQDKVKAFQMKKNE